MNHSRFPVIPRLSELLWCYFSRAPLPDDLQASLPPNLPELLHPYGLEIPVRYALNLSLPDSIVARANRTLALLTRAEEISHKLTTEAIPHIFTRGGFLAALYPHPADRTFSDLDLLVPPAYTKQVLALAKTWGAHTASKDRANFVSGYWDGIMLFLPPPTRLLLELHIDLAPPHRFPQPNITLPPVAAKDILPLQAFAVILHCTTHHYEAPVKAMCDLLLLASLGLDWDDLQRLIDARRAWNAVNPFMLEFEEFAPNVIPKSWKEQASHSRRAGWIHGLAEGIAERGGVYSKGSFWRRSLVTTLALPNAEHALRALTRGLAMRLNRDKIKAS